MESWSWSSILSQCQGVPSSCETRVPLYPNPLTVLANGSQFVYFLDSKKKQQVAVLKFSAAVVHISGMNFHDEMEPSMITCCLADGQIMAVSTKNFLKKVWEQSEEDGREPPSSGSSQLFLGPSAAKPPRPSRRRAAINARPISSCIGICPASEWVLISAVVLDSNMCVCRRSRSMGSVSYVLLRSHQRNVRVPSGGRGTITIPSFVGAMEVQSLVASTESGYSAMQRITPDYMPVCTVLRSEKHPPMCCGEVVTMELFLCLFGPELQLSGSPVMVVGCQNGNVYFTNLAGSSQTGLGAQHCSDQEFMSPLYSLAQPVVGIHTVYFPGRKAPELDDPFALQEVSPVDDSAESKTHNAVVFIGQAGKIVVCYTGSDGQSFPRFQEFDVPAPVLSSVLVSGQCLLYSTLQGLYRICLRRECVDCIEEKIPPSSERVQSIRIPEVSFKFPEMVQNLPYRSYLLHSDATSSSGLDLSPAEPHGAELQFLCVSLDGHLSTIRDREEGPGTLKKTSTGVGQELKQCLQCIQLQSEEVDRVMEKIRSLNVLLLELKSALDMLLAVRGVAIPHSSSNSHSRSPFTCSFKTTREKVGASAEKVCVAVEVTYRQHKASAGTLSGDWSLLVISQPGKHSISKSVSLAGLVAGDSVTLAMDVGVAELEGGGSCVECFLHYSPQRLCRSLTWDDHSKKSDTFKGVSLFLAKKDFDILDFLHQSKHGPTREALSSFRNRIVRRILSESADTAESASAPPRPALLHSVALPISLSTATSTIQMSSPSVSAESLQGMSPGEVAAALLNVLIPAISGKQKSSAVAAEVLTRFDGEGVGFRLSSVGEDGGGEEGMVLEIRASSKNMLVLVAGCVSTRLRRGRGEPEGSGEVCDHRTVCGRLAALKKVLQEVGMVQQEISASHQEWRTNCMSGEAYHKAMLTWKAKACSIYCKLREIR